MGLLTTLAGLVAYVRERIPPLAAWGCIPDSFRGPIIVNFVKNVFDIIWPWITWCFNGLLIRPLKRFWTKLRRIRHPNDSSRVVDTNQKLRDDIDDQKWTIKNLEEEKDKLFKIIENNLKILNEFMEEKKSQSNVIQEREKLLENMKDDVNVLQADIHGKDKELKSIKDELASAQDALKQLLLEKKIIRSRYEPMQADGEMETKYYMKDELQATDGEGKVNALNDFEDIRESTLGYPVDSLCNILNSLISTLKECGKDVLGEDEYDMSEVKDMVNKITQLKNKIECKPTEQP